MPLQPWLTNISVVTFYGVQIIINHQALICLLRTVRLARGHSMKCKNAMKPRTQRSRLCSRLRSFLKSLVISRSCRRPCLSPSTPKEIWSRLQAHVHKRPLPSPVWLIILCFVSETFVCILFPQLYWDIVDMWHCVRFRYIMWYDIHTHCRMITMVRLVNVSITSHS